MDRCGSGYRLINNFFTLVCIGYLRIELKERMWRQWELGGLDIRRQNVILLVSQSGILHFDLIPQFCC